MQSDAFAGHHKSKVAPRRFLPPAHTRNNLTRTSVACSNSQVVLFHPHSLDLPNAFLSQCHKDEISACMHFLEYLIGLVDFSCAFLTCFPRSKGSPAGGARGLQVITQG